MLPVGSLEYRSDLYHFRTPLAKFLTPAARLILLAFVAFIARQFRCDREPYQ